MPLYFRPVVSSFFLMAAHSNGQAIIFYPCGFYLSSSFFLFFLLFSIADLTGRRLHDVYHNSSSTHDVALCQPYVCLT